MPDCAIAATLNQNGRHVAFSSGTRNITERKYSVEAYGIVKSVRKWRHYPHQTLCINYNCSSDIICKQIVIIGTYITHLFLRF